MGGAKGELRGRSGGGAQVGAERGGIYGVKGSYGGLAGRWGVLGGGGGRGGGGRGAVAQMCKETAR